MPHRQSVTRHACELCRQRKRKCNGDDTNPCKSCEESGAECVYLAPRRVSKADLREELAQLQSINSENSILLDAISSTKTTSEELNYILRRLSDGQPRSEVAIMLTKNPNNHTSGIWDNSSNLSTRAPSSASPVSPGILLSSTQEGAIDSITSETTPFPTAISTPEASFRANLSHYRSQLPQLLDTILTRDCLSFCPISKEDFMRDLESDSGQYCSTALIDSLLALATLLAQEQIASVTTLQPIGTEDLGNAFAQEAIAALYNGTGLPLRTADIQALGILSIYCLGGGKMKDGQGFASDFGAAITEQWRNEQPLQPGSRSFADRQTHANIYCAAISFNRVLFLINDYNMSLEELAVKVGMELVISEGKGGNGPSSSANLSGSMIDDAFFTKDLSLLPNNPRVIAAKVFELTELIYKTRYHTEERSFSQAVRAYQEALRWYESFFAYTSSCNSNTPLVLFAHTYYQFCVLCLWTPCVIETVPLASDGIHPADVCKQAANSIEKLIQHYRKLCNDGQLLHFMPSFKSASRSFLEIFETKIQV